MELAAASISTQPGGLTSSAACYPAVLTECFPETRFPVRICIETPPNGFGQQLNAMYAWLDHNCGADAWESWPAGFKGVVNDALAIYLLDPTLAAAFVHRWCIGYRVETAKGSFRMREDAPTPRAAQHP